MPKWKTSKQTENKGIIKLKEIVNENNCIYRDVPGETDTGIDGFIEFVDSENVTGQIVAVQVKTGQSYFNKTTDEFELDIDEDKLNYWKNYMLPVIIFFYLPSIKLGAWIPIKEFIEHEEYHGRVPITKIKVSVKRELNCNNFPDVREYTKMNFDYKFSLTWLDKCLDGDEKDILDNFLILSNHPYSRDNKVTLFIARHLVRHNSEKLLKEVLWLLGYGAGRSRWSWNPNNSNERDIIDYACEICSSLNQDELYKLLCIIDDEGFHGPMALGERYLDVVSCCVDTALPMLYRVAENKTEPLQRRLNALYVYYGCDDEALEEAFDEKSYDNSLDDLFEFIFKKEDI
ncbi:DUF4365 domain-containing protein [Desnuesiella massiliensis]|uniref:DUF4365 domain-containing protein n=1 Tax=Desnuesiella massiliensis TaxID=1650662 RepID=UPI0006E3DA2B|nr:DUF4365 domain-containing protein [Desnuesiella massiliensis]